MNTLIHYWLAFRALEWIVGWVSFWAWVVYFWVKAHKAIKRLKNKKLWGRRK